LSGGKRWQVVATDLLPPSSSLRGGQQSRVEEGGKPPYSTFLGSRLIIPGWLREDLMMLKRRRRMMIFQYILL